MLPVLRAHVSVCCVFVVSGVSWKCFFEVQAFYARCTKQKNSTQKSNRISCSCKFQPILTHLQHTHTLDGAHIAAAAVGPIDVCALVNNANGRPLTAWRNNSKNLFAGRATRERLTPLRRQFLEPHALGDWQCVRGAVQKMQFSFKTIKHERTSERGTQRLGRWWTVMCASAFCLCRKTNSEASGLCGECNKMTTIIRNPPEEPTGVNEMNKFQSITTLCGLCVAYASEHP